MQNSRLGRLGKQTLKNRSNFTLMQSINPGEFSDDRPIKNANTFYLDENGRQTQVPPPDSPTIENKQGSIKKTRRGQELDEVDTNHKDMYALPVVNMSEVASRQKAKESRLKMVQSQYMTERSGLDAIREQQNRIQDTKKSLLSIKRPKGLRRRNQKFEQIDFIGGNLYQVQDIISDIVKIMDHGKQRSIIAVTKEVKGPTKQNKWLNNNFGLSKLDQMLLSYKTTANEGPAPIPITEEFYRESTYNREAQEKEKAKTNGLAMGNRLKNKQNKLSLAVIKWNQLPMIGASWSPVYLKLQSYPQQEEYRKVVLKAYASKMQSYSIFCREDAGLVRSASNDKNLSGAKLMSQEQYAKAWQEHYPESSQLSEQEKQLLMEFDIEWYRSIIELCYHSGLEDLLEKDYDVGNYVAVVKEINEHHKEATAELIIRNQLLYLRQYFGQVYHSGSTEVVLGVIRINNDERMGLEEVYDNFKMMLAQAEPHEQDDPQDDIQFAMWPLDQDNRSLIVLLPLCSPQIRRRVKMHKEKEFIEVAIENPQCCIRVSREDMQEETGNSVLLREKSGSQWDVSFKMKKQVDGGIKFQINMVEQLLFGLLYAVDATKL